MTGAKTGLFVAAFLLCGGGAASAGAGASSESVGYAFREACAAEEPALILVVEITIPDVVERKAFRFALARKEAASSGTSGVVCGTIHGEVGDELALPGEPTSNYGGSVSLGEIVGNSAGVSVSYYWNSPANVGRFDRRITASLLEPEEFRFDGGVVVTTRIETPPVTGDE